MAFKKTKPWNIGLTKETDERVRKEYVKKVFINCKYCNKEVKCYPSTIKQFCNKKCYDKYKIGIKRPNHSIKLKEAHKRKSFGYKKGELIGEKNYAKLPEVRKKISEKMKGKNNSNYKLTEQQKRNKVRNYLKTIRKNPERHPNRIMAKKGFISKPQMEIYLLIKSKYPEAELEYPIKTKHSIRFADIAIPSLKLDIEYDGQQWHTNKQLDNLRDKHLKEVGWKTIRFNKNNIHLLSLPKQYYWKIKNDTR